MRSLSYISGDICNPLAFRARMLLLIVSFAFIACISGCGGSNATASTVPVAGAIEVWPTDMVAISSNQYARQEPTLISSSVPSASGPTNVAYYALLSLPVGSEISSVEYYYQGTSSAAYTSLQLQRSKFGEEAELLFAGSANGDTSFVINTVNVPASAVTPIMVEADYRYYVVVTAENAESFIRGVKVQYQ